MKFLKKNIQKYKLPKEIKLQNKKSCLKTQNLTFKDYTRNCCPWKTGRKKINPDFAISFAQLRNLLQFISFCKMQFQLEI